VDGAIVQITAVADSRENIINMPRTKIDAVASRSMISKRNADISNAVRHSLPTPQTIRDSSGRFYDASQRINLRCAIEDAAVTFSEDFFVVESLEHDAILRLNAGRE
jgi:hypothetical protein